MTPLAWWTWPLLWGGLTLILIAVIVVSAIALFRKSLVLADDLATLAETSAALAEVDELLEARANEPRPRPAMIADHDEVRARRHERRRLASDRRHSRRQARLQRAKMITTVDATQLRKIEQSLEQPRNRTQEQRMWPNA